MRHRLFAAAVLAGAVCAANAQEPPAPARPATPPSPVSPARRAADRPPSSRDPYTRGTAYLDRRSWNEAIAAFDEVIANNNTRTDGALYWKAYALGKLGRRQEAQEQLNDLSKRFADSRWLGDAKALALEMQQAGGQRVEPDRVDDDELKLIAINGLMGSDPSRAVPMLERILKSTQSSRVKERALFVLAQSSNTQAKQTVATIARTGNPDLQYKAIEFLGMAGRDNAALLSEVYRSSNDARVKRAVLKAYMLSSDRDRLLEAAKGEKDADVRREAIHLLGITHGSAELGQLYAAESDPKLRAEMLRSMALSGDATKLMEVARSERDAATRREAIRSMGIVSDPRVAETLASMYQGESDREIKKEIVRALMIKGSAKTLVDLARKESDPQLKRELVRTLSMTNSKEADDFMQEILK